MRIFYCLLHPHQREQSSHHEHASCVDGVCTCLDAGITSGPRSLLAVHNGHSISLLKHQVLNKAFGLNTGVLQVCVYVCGRAVFLLSSLNWNV